MFTKVMRMHLYSLMALLIWSTACASDIVGCVFSGPVRAIDKSNFYINERGDHLDGFIVVENSESSHQTKSDSTCKNHLGSSIKFSFNPEKKPIEIGTLVEITWYYLEPSDDQPGGTMISSKILE
ncbi:hypothetical protein [Arenicella xantha]|uniref:Uncharacterized protein n=1 Tax=Arenicella xantha TaxID=644221 RepID=A0A395JFD8_9GAMM|nr:hypothetical protein [Arenicella xantha]RBP46606.1 hypothetical protein DFR28_1174 [Arenicella xantha]